MLKIPSTELMASEWELINEWMMHLCSAFIVYCCTPKSLKAIMWGGLSSTTTSVQHPLGRCHRTTAPECSPHTSYRWRGERVIEPIKCMRSPHNSYRWRWERVIEPIKCMRSPHTSYIETIQVLCAHHTPATGGEERNFIEPIQVLCFHHTPATGWERRESIRDNQGIALTTHQITGGRGGESHRAQSSVCAHPTPATGGEERES